MKISNKGLDLICKYEGFFSNPYICPAGVPTIGYGTTYYSDGKKVTLKDKPINRDEAKAILKDIIVRYESDVKRLVKKPLNQNQFDALVSFTYNLGATNLGKSTLLKKVNVNPNDPTIRDEFNKWVNGGGRKLSGLVKRRKDEGNLYFS